MMEKSDIDIKQSQNAKLAKPRNLGKKIFKPKGLVVLYGGLNTGKTSTLTELLFELTNTSIMAYFNKHMISTKSKKLQYQDGYYIVEYRGHWIFIATGGDSLEVCENNDDFFDGKPSRGNNYYVIHTNDMQPSTINKSDVAKYQPDICVCPCHKDGETMLATRYLASKRMKDCLLQCWFQKIGMSKNQEPEYVYPSVPIITADDQLTAAEIKKAIDQIIK